MTRNYQQERYAYESHSQSQASGSEQSTPHEEYKDLYDPFRNKWKKALGHIGVRAPGQVLSNSKGYAVSLGKDHKETNPYGRRMPHAYSSGFEQNRHGQYSSFESEQALKTKSPYSKHEVSSEGEKNIAGREHFSSPYKWTNERRSEKQSTKHNSFKAEVDRNTYGHYTTGYGPWD
jgi:hypothetical protein